MMVVWSLTGMWHGASWNFILWGMYYGVLLITERFVIGRERMDKIPYIFRLPVIFVITMLGWVLFYHTDLSLAFRQIGAMFGIGFNIQLIDPLTSAVIRKYSVLPLIAAVASLPVLPALKKHSGQGGFTEALSYAAATVLMVLSAVFLVGQSYNPFIYFRF